jgi:hypothetical protein
LALKGQGKATPDHPQAVCDTKQSGKRYRREGSAVMLWILSLAIRPSRRMTSAPVGSVTIHDGRRRAVERPHVNHQNGGRKRCSA